MTLTVQQQTTTPSTTTTELQLRPAASWSSFEQFRVEGPAGLIDSIPYGGVGRLRVRDYEFAILHWRDFDRLHGAAQDVRRLSHGVLLLHQAASVVMSSADKDLGVEMIRNLTLQYQLPAVGSPPMPSLELTPEADDDAGSEMVAFQPPRPTW